MPAPLEHLEYELQIGRYLAAKNFTGVKLITLANDNMSTAILRVRPSGHEWQWECRLICPSTEVVYDLFNLERPGACMFLAACADKVKLQTILSQVDIPEISERKRKKIRKGIQNEIRITEKLSRKQLKHFSYLLHDKDVVGSQEILELVPKVLGHKVREEAIAAVLEKLVFEGLLEPVIGGWKDGNPLFKTLDLCRELEEDYRNYIRQEENQRRQSQIQAKKQQLEAMEKRKTKVALQLEQLSGEIVALQSELKELEQQP